jgi:hypothetical protein
MVAHLSDGSALDYTDTSLTSAAGSTGAVYVFTYKAASSGQQLVITFTQNDNNGGNVTLQAATLVAGVQAPVITSVLATSGSGQAAAPNVDPATHAINVFPNPWKSALGVPAITFDVPAGSTIKIFTVSGHWVKTLAAPATLAPWDLTNDSGDKVASGIYIYLVTDAQNNNARGKLVVIR